uniref:Uncharacterized protein n=1 Tax=Anguilla anguilla TaxID=7936 RepID=A0A0E9UC63_ANGAN
MIVLRCALSLPGSGVMLFKSRCLSVPGVTEGSRPCMLAHR